MNINTHRPSLEEVRRKLWSELQAGAERASHPFHAPGLATSTDDGPAVRMVVLRHADPEGGKLMCHTDLRSRKFAELLANPATAWLFYDREQKIQLRMLGNTALHHRDALAGERWRASPEFSRECYGADPPPGTPLDSGSSTPWLSEGGFANFAVLVSTITSIDWLFLRAAGHLRARFTRQDGAWRGEWIAP